MAIFLISGWKFSLRNAKLNHKFIYAVVTAIVISLFIAPFIGVGAVKIFGFEAMAALGIIVTCCVPVTLSSATVITEVAHGNAVWALLMTVIMNLTGIFTIPLMLKLCLEESRRRQYFGMETPAETHIIGTSAFCRRNGREEIDKSKN